MKIVGKKNNRERKLLKLKAYIKNYVTFRKVQCNKNWTLIKFSPTFDRS